MADPEFNHIWDQELSVPTSARHSCPFFFFLPLNNSFSVNNFLIARRSIFYKLAHNTCELDYPVCRPLTPPLDVKFQEWRGLIKSHPPFLERENRICLADSDAPRPPDPTPQKKKIKCYSGER